MSIGNDIHIITLLWFLNPTCLRWKRHKTSGKTCTATSLLSKKQSPWCVLNLWVENTIYSSTGLKLWSPPDGSNDRWAWRNQVITEFLPQHPSLLMLSVLSSTMVPASVDPPSLSTYPYRIPSIHDKHPTLLAVLGCIDISKSVAGGDVINRQYLREGRATAAALRAFKGKWSSISRQFIYWLILRLESFLVRRFDRGSSGERRTASRFISIYPWVWFSTPIHFYTLISFVYRCPGRICTRYLNSVQKMVCLM